MDKHRSKVNSVNGSSATGRGSALGRGVSKVSQVVIQRNPYYEARTKEESFESWYVEFENAFVGGKLENVKYEMSCCQINVLGLWETQWTGENDFYSDDFRIISSGGDAHERGVAVVLDKRAANTVQKIRFEGDRLLAAAIEL